MRAAFIIALILVATRLGAQPVAILPDIDPAYSDTGYRFEEELRDKATISLVSVVAGIAFRSPPGVERPTVHAMFPADWQGPVCARWLSTDALYTASATYSPPKATDGGMVTARLEYPGIHGDWLRDLTLEQMGITLRQGACDQTATPPTPEPEVFVPAIWNGRTDAAPDRLVILVNARGADETYVIVRGEDTTVDLDCDRIVGTPTVGIDHLCEVPLATLSGSRLGVELNRLRRGQPDRPVVFSIDLPR